MTRRRTLTRLVTAPLLLGLVVAACGDDDETDDTSADETTDSSEPADEMSDEATASSEDMSEGASEPVELETVSFQLDWVPNTNHTGLYVADALGYYADAGIELEILPYSGSSGDTIVAEGQGDFAISFQNSITLSKPAGAEITTVAAVVQHAAEAIAVRADRDDIASPADLDGKLYAGFGGAFEVPVMTAVIQAAGGEGEFESVILDTAAYEAVYNDSADFVIPFKTWEGIEAELSDEPLKYFEYTDYGLPDQYSVIIIAQEAWLADNADLATRFLDATRRGYQYGIENPDEAAQILIDENPGVFSEPELVFQSQQLLADEYYLDDDGAWGCVTAEQFAGYSGFLYEAGIVAGPDGGTLAEEPDWSTFYDMTYLGC
ncbi:MAG: ABC transporter substrate-binding protein [Ilumatobacteraceae bacterium]|uniref:ABC transporter substrate-binding protein n=1 Tax=Ilumatobacter fluminis TaxID=467091 RepID=UPI0029689D41|nr:ABC transporter substrate-binding protein [Ilumatobacteraceae bacterium]